VDPALATLLEFKVLYGVCYIDFAAIDSSRVERAVQKLAGWADERPASEVLCIAWLFADECHCRALRPFSQNGLGAVDK
jgi:hypothetical protein